MSSPAHCDALQHMRMCLMQKSPTNTTAHCNTRCNTQTGCLPPLIHLYKQPVNAFALHLCAPRQERGVQEAERGGAACLALGVECELHSACRSSAPQWFRLSSSECSHRFIMCCSVSFASRVAAVCVTCRSVCCIVFPSVLIESCFNCA